jgi:holo-[acyl-carrier protein] synthase
MAAGYLEQAAGVMGIRGVGIDLVDVARVGRMLDQYGERVLGRLLTPTERSYCVDQAHPAQHVAARIAAKEAAFKALARDEEGLRIGWTELEVVRDADGRPGLRLYGRAGRAAERLGVESIHVSITHERAHAAAFVILEA